MELLIHTCKSEMEPYGWLWMGGNYPEDGTASAEPLHSASAPFDVHHCGMISAYLALSHTLKAFPSHGLGCVLIKASAFGCFLCHKFILNPKMSRRGTGGVHKPAQKWRSVTTAWTSHRNWPSSHPQDEKGR